MNKAMDTFQDFPPSQRRQFTPAHESLGVGLQPKEDVCQQHNRPTDKPELSTSYGRDTSPWQTQPSEQGAASAWVSTAHAESLGNTLAAEDKAARARKGKRMVQQPGAGFVASRSGYLAPSFGSGINSTSLHGLHDLQVSGVVAHFTVHKWLQYTSQGR
eukprot:jgi/Chrzof1/12063/Cz06g20020.t1